MSELSRQSIMDALADALRKHPDMGMHDPWIGPRIDDSMQVDGDIDLGHLADAVLQVLRRP